MQRWIPGTVAFVLWPRGLPGGPARAWPLAVAMEPHPQAGGPRLVFSQQAQPLYSLWGGCWLLPCLLVSPLYGRCHPQPQGKKVWSSVGMPVAVPFSGSHSTGSWGKRPLCVQWPTWGHGGLGAAEFSFEGQRGSEGWAGRQASIPQTLDVWWPSSPRLRRCLVPAVLERSGYSLVSGRCPRGFPARPLDCLCGYRCGFHPWQPAESPDLY